MEKNQISGLMKGLIYISQALILLGAFFKILHYAYGNMILMIGFLSITVLSSIEINRLRKTVKKLKEELNDL